MALELVLIPIAGHVEDSGFTSDAWRGVCRYAEQNGVPYTTYSPKAISTAARVETLHEAVRNGAKKIVTVGHRFGDAVHLVHEEYPQVRFLLVGGPPLDADGNPAPIGPNVLTIDFAEEQAGFLAGYASVMDGNRHLAFLGGIESFPAIRRYGYGFLQGADYAGKVIGLSQAEVQIDYMYCGTVDADPIATKKAEELCKSGVEVLFVCGGALGRVAMSVAEVYGVKTIGVDVDQSSESASVLTSACKNLSLAIYETLSLCEQPSCCGKRHLYDAKKQGIYLPMDASRFKNFQSNDYEEIMEKLRNGSISVLSEKDQNGKPYHISDLSINHVFVAQGYK